MAPSKGVETATEPRLPDRGVARRMAFLHAARGVFLEQGYEAASVNEVVRRAGGSLATLYAQFGNKEGLLLAIAQDQYERFVRAMMPECVDHLPLEEALQQIGERFTRTLLERDNIAFFRLVIGERRKFPDLLRDYLTSSAERIRGELAARLARAGVTDAETGAGFFMDLLRGRHHYRALADENYELSDAELKAHVAGAVRFLLSGLGMR